MTAPAIVSKHRRDKQRNGRRREGEKKGESYHAAYCPQRFSPTQRMRACDRGKITLSADVCGVYGDCVLLQRRYTRVRWSTSRLTRLVVNPKRHRVHARQLKRISPMHRRICVRWLSTNPSHIHMQQGAQSTFAEQTADGFIPAQGHR